jgi:plastocyanin
VQSYTSPAKAQEREEEEEESLEHAKNIIIPTAESVYNSQSIKIPSTVKSFIILIPNEAHEEWEEERHKLITDKNPYFIPKHLIISEGTSVSFINADAPWNTPNPHRIEIIDSFSGNVVNSTALLQYGEASNPLVLSAGNYTMEDPDHEQYMKGTITVTNEKSTAPGGSSGSNLIVGGFYTPTKMVENTKDNDGIEHPGWLNYYKAELPKNGFQILSEYNFTYATCDYCPGKYWPDNKSGEHTSIIYSTEQPLSDALEKLKS